MTFEPFATKDFNSQFQRSLGRVSTGGACVGEIAQLAQAIDDGNTASWNAAWHGLAVDLNKRALAESADGFEFTAGGLFFRACEAYRQASFFHRVDLDCEELQTAWRHCEACFQAAMDSTSYTCEAIEIPYDGRFLHGYLAWPGAIQGPLPTVIVPSGYDSCVEEVMMMNGLSALARGYAVLAVDGPGQGKTLYDPATRAYMRPDYEAVMTPIVDYALARPEVDADRLVAIGCSFAGYLVPRAAAYEQRLAAIVADPGQYDIGAALLAMLPVELSERIDDDCEGAIAAFEQLAAGRDGALLFRPRMAAHGVDTVQAYIRQMRAYHNCQSAPLITTPSLICDNEVDRVSTGQGRALADAMPNAAVDFVRFTAAEGAGGHCEIIAREIFDERAYRWLHGVLSNSSH